MAKNYLMLDKDDITNVCGVISSKDARKELGITVSQFHTFLYLGKLFRDKYILVEDIEEKEKKELYSRFILETEAGRKYYARSDGVFYVVCKSGKTKELTGYTGKKRGKLIHMVKLGNKDYVCKNLMASLFLNDYKPGDVVILRNNRYKDVSVENLIVIDKALYAKKTGPMSRSQPVGLFEDGKLIKQWRSARRAAKDLFCSYQMVIDCCNNKWKTKEFDVRWL